MRHPLLFLSMLATASVFVSACSSEMTTQELSPAEVEMVVDEIRMTAPPLTSLQEEPLRVDVDLSTLRAPALSEWEHRTGNRSVLEVTNDTHRVRITMKTSDVRAQGLLAEDVALDLSGLTGLTMRSPDGELMAVGGSMKRAMSDAVMSLCGEAVAAGSLKISGSPAGVEIAMVPTPDDELNIDVTADVFGECNGVVWGADDCNDGECSIAYMLDGGVGLIVPGNCVFTDVPWNPWNYCNCEGQP